jgi:iron complex outermembrane receptor protein
LQGNINTADVSSYGEAKTEYSGAGIVAFQYKVKKLQSNISVRKEYNSQYSIPIIYNCGIQYGIFQKKARLRASAGTKYRTPTFNDLYWKNSGNPNLKPEYGFSYEFGSQINIIQKQKTKVTTDISYYNSTINDMIMWNEDTLDSQTIWRPINMAQATLQGIEFQLKHSQEFHSISIQNMVGFDFNNSRITKVYNSQSDIAAIGHSLYYVPKISINYNPEIEYKKWIFGLSSHYQSSRYYNLTDKFTDCLLFDMNIKHAVTTKKITSIFNFQVKNIWNVNYELIRSYPMPGRYFEFSLQFLLNN